LSQSKASNRGSRGAMYISDGNCFEGDDMRTICFNWCSTLY